MWPVSKLFVCAITLLCWSGVMCQILPPFPLCTLNEMPNDMATINEDNSFSLFIIFLDNTDDQCRIDLKGNNSEQYQQVLFKPFPRPEDLWCMFRPGLADDGRVYLKSTSAQNVSEGMYNMKFAGNVTLNSFFYGKETKNVSKNPIIKHLSSPSNMSLVTLETSHRFQKCMQRLQMKGIDPFNTSSVSCSPYGKYKQKTCQLKHLAEKTATIVGNWSVLHNYTHILSCRFKKSIYADVAFKILVDEKVGTAQDAAALTYALPTVVILIFILVGGIIWAYVRNTRRPYKLVQLKNLEALPMDILENGTFENGPAYYEEILPEWLDPNLVKPQEALILQEELGRGTFGIVYRGLLKDGRAEYTVAVKEAKHVSAIEDLWNEAHSMVRLKHTNIVNLQAVIVNVFPEELRLLLEFCSKGNLKLYLQKKAEKFEANILGHLDCTATPTSPHMPKSSMDLLIKWCIEVASALSVICKENIYQGDIAARNVLLTDHLVAKVGDFGLSKRLYADVTCNVHEKLLPIQWLAYEVLKDQEASAKSNVWSYAVLVWEVFQLGFGYPYDIINFRVSDLRTRLENGDRPKKPRICPADLYKLMLECWELIPEIRPGFDVIIGRLENFKNKQWSFVDLQTNQQVNAMYMKMNGFTTQDDDDDDYDESSSSSVSYVEMMMTNITLQDSSDVEPTFRCTYPL